MGPCAVPDYAVAHPSALPFPLVEAATHAADPLDEGGRDAGTGECPDFSPPIFRNGSKAEEVSCSQTRFSGASTSVGLLVEARPNTPTDSNVDRPKTAVGGPNR